MSGNDKQNAHDTKEKIGAVLDDEYQGKEVVFIAFDKEKTSVTLDDNFVIIEAIEKREKLVKVAAAIFSLLCLVAIICASIFLMVSDSKNARNGQSILAEASGGGTEYVPLPTLEVTKAPTIKPTRKPTPKPTKRPEPKPTQQVITPQPVTEPPRQTAAPKVTQKPKDDDVFIEDKKPDDVFVY